MREEIKCAINTDCICNMETEFKAMDKRMSDLEEKMSSIDAKLTQVVDAILGNALTKSGGFIKDIVEMDKKIKLLEAKVESQEEFKKKFLWTVGLVVAIGALTQYIASMYYKLKN